MYPNPCLLSKVGTVLTIAGLTASAKIKIYTVTGELVRELEESDGDGRVTWDGKDNSGKEVIGGVYLYVITSAKGTKKGKISVIK